MRTLTLINIVGGLVAAGLAAAFYAEAGPFGDPLVKACEEALVKRLRSPSGYKRVAVVKSERVLTVAQYQLRAGRVPTQSELESIAAGRKTPKIFAASIAYDAPNAFGTPVRGFAECEHLESSGKIGTVYSTLVTIDGETNLAYFNRLLKEAN